MRRKPIISASNRYRVTLLIRPERAHPFQLRIVDRLTSEVTREVVRSATLRQKGRAYEVAAAREKELNAGAHQARAVTWQEFKAAYLAAYAIRNRRRSLQEIRSVLGMFERFCQPEYVEHASTSDVRRFLDSAHGLSKATVNKRRRCLNCAFVWAIAEGMIQTNPCAGTRPLKEDHRPPIVLAEKEDRIKFFKGMSDRGAMWSAAARLAYRTGVRIGELSHLTWRSVNLTERFLLVQPEPDGGGNLIADWSKMWAAKGHRIRLQVLDEEIVGHLTALRQRAVYDLVAVGLVLDDAEHLCAFSTAQTDAVRVFGGPNPDRFEKDFRWACKEVCERLRLPPIRPHGLRKTYGTVLAERGLNEFALASVMGHRDPKTTRDYYVLLRQKKLSAEALRLLDAE